MFDLDDFRALAKHQEPSRVRDAMLAAAADGLVAAEAEIARLGTIILRTRSELAAAGRELERIGEETKDANAAFAWQERVCAIVQPAQNADERGADVADIIAWRLAELERARAVVERAREWRRGGLYDARLDELLAAYDAGRERA